MLATTAMQTVSASGGCVAVPVSTTRAEGTAWNAIAPSVSTDTFSRLGSGTCAKGAVQRGPWPPRGSKTWSWRSLVLCQRDGSSAGSLMRTVNSAGLSSRRPCGQTMKTFPIKADPEGTWRGGEGSRAGAAEGVHEVRE